MTCIVAIKGSGGTIFMGGDSAGVCSNFDLRRRTDEKVFIKDGMIFGYTSSFRMGQIIRYSLDIPKHDPDMDKMEYMVSVFIPALRKALKKGGYTKVSNNEETGGIFIIGFKGELFQIEDDFQVGLHKDDFTACGCGEPFALGSLFSSPTTNTKVKILEALKCAEYFSGGVRGPMIVKAIDSCGEDIS